MERTKREKKWGTQMRWRRLTLSDKVGSQKKPAAKVLPGTTKHQIRGFRVSRSPSFLDGGFSRSG
jgi:hypothetical protein